MFTFTTLIYLNRKNDFSYSIFRYYIRIEESLSKVELVEGIMDTSVELFVVKLLPWANSPNFNGEFCGNMNELQCTKIVHDSESRSL